MLVKYNLSINHLLADLPIDFYSASVDIPSPWDGYNGCSPWRGPKLGVHSSPRRSLLGVFTPGEGVFHLGNGSSEVQY